MIAPFDFHNNSWDWDGDISSWYEDYQFWVDLLIELSTAGEYNQEAFELAVDATDSFTESLFGPYAAPDPVVDYYPIPYTDAPSAEWELERSWLDLAKNQNELDGLDRGALTFDSEGDAYLLVIADNDPFNDDFAGGILITADLVEELVDQGPVGVVFSQQEMDKYGTRLNALELTVE